MVFIPKASEKDQEEVFKRIKKVLPKLKEKLNIIQIKDLDSITIKELIEKNKTISKSSFFFNIKIGQTGKLTSCPGTPYR